MSDDSTPAAIPDRPGEPTTEMETRRPREAPDPGDEDASRSAIAGWTREQLGEAFRQIRSAYAELDDRPDEGLRERKKRIMRQQISDVATWMFCERGFDEVRIAEIADEVGVSEKTVYNYFPTKESLVFDREEELAEALRSALGERGPDVSPTEAFLSMIETEVAHYEFVDPAVRPMMLEFGRLIERTPALKSAMREMTARLVEVATDALAEGAQVDPRDPEPQIAAQALIGLWDVHMVSRRRHILAGVSGGELRDAVMDDTRRAARLLETGLWSFNSIVQGVKTRTQLADAARTANEARKQVVEALRQARDAWAEVRRAHDEAHHSAEGSWFERHAAGEQAEREQRRARRAERQAQADAQRAEARAQADVRRAQADAQRAAARAKRR